jgi:hypothetical protein
MTEQAEALDQDIRAFLIDATLAGRSAHDMAREVAVRWGAAGVAAADRFADEFIAAQPRAERRRVKRQRRRGKTR